LTPRAFETPPPCRFARPHVVFMRAEDDAEDPFEFECDEFDDEGPFDDTPTRLARIA